jgi:hypothetical protein
MALAILIRISAIAAASAAPRVWHRAFDGRGELAAANSPAAVPFRTGGKDKVIHLGDGDAHGWAPSAVPGGIASRAGLLAISFGWMPAGGVAHLIGDDQTRVGFDGAGRLGEGE